MAFVVAPSLPIKAITWTLKQQRQINIGAYNGVRSVASNPWFGQWKASVTLAQQQGDSAFATFLTFIAALNGSAGVFRLYATTGPQNSNTNVTLTANAAQGATTVALSTPMAPGQYITINGQLLLLSNGGSGVTFTPPLRRAATAGTPVVTSRPYALVYLANPDQAWSISPYRLFDMSFDVTEAILETDGVTVPETELVINGTFASSTTGWNASSATLSVVSGRLRVTNSGATNGNASQSFTLIPGKSYTFKWDGIAGTASSLQVQLFDGTSFIFTSSVVGAGQSTTFVATTSTLTIYLSAFDNVAGHYSDFDNISLMEA